MSIDLAAPAQAAARQAAARIDLRQAIVVVVGLGYVGLPLAAAFGREFRTIGFDVSEEKIRRYSRHEDPMGEVGERELREAARLEYTADASAIRAADIVIVAVPTPVDEAHLPDFGPLLGACDAIGPHLRTGAIVVFESTVYPGATEEVCVPALERASGMRWKEGFFVGYSPERINPGDAEHRLARITKVVSGDGPETLAAIAALYGAVVAAGVHRAPSIKVAEAAKVIENTQRDLNIALMNELAVIFHRMGIDTADVLEAAGTKWNFLPFRPGLVGGHCIGVDPYYLTHAAEKFGHHPEVILSGRRINDSMGKYVAEQAVKRMVRSGKPVTGARVVVLGLAFKENCGDVRNSKVVDLIREFESYGIEVSVHDPRVQDEDAMREYGIALRPWDALPPCDAIVLAVPHRELVGRPLDELLSKARPGACVIDVKSALDREAVEELGFSLWRL